MSQQVSEITDITDGTDISNIGEDDLFWYEVLKLLTLLLPLLRLILLAELNIQVIGKFYPAMLSVKSHLHAKHDLLPYGWKIRDKFISKAVVGEWLQDIHLAAYVLDPEYWDVDNLNMADSMQAFSDCIEKNFHFKKAPVDCWHLTLLCQLRTYKIFQSRVLQDLRKICSRLNFLKHTGWQQWNSRLWLEGYSVRQSATTLLS